MTGVGSAPRDLSAWMRDVNKRLVAQERRRNPRAQLQPTVSNGLVNPSFEQDFEGWLTGGLAGTPDYGTVSGTESRSGVKSLLTNDDGTRIAQGPISVEPGQRWRLSFWYKTTANFAAAGTWAVIVTPDADSGTSYGGVAGAAQFPASTSWVERSATITIPSGVSEVYVRIDIAGATSVGSLWLDDFAFERLPEWDDIGGKPTTFPPSAHTHSATDITSGELNNARLPARIRGAAQLITDWNYALTNGFYVGNDAANAPEATGWFLGYVEARNTLWVTQTVHAFDAADEGPADTRMYRRDRNNGQWQAWYRLRPSEAEQALLWAAKDHSHTWAQITGKPSTFPPSAHTHDAGDITSGTLPVERGGTGQTSVSGVKDAYGISALESGMGSRASIADVEAAGYNSYDFAPEELGIRWINDFTHYTSGGWDGVKCRQINGMLMIYGVAYRNGTSTGLDMLQLPPSIQPAAEYQSSGTVQLRNTASGFTIRPVGTIGNGGTVHVFIIVPMPKPQPSPAALPLGAGVASSLIDTGWSNNQINATPFRKSPLATQTIGGTQYQFAAYYNSYGQIVVARRTWGSSTWTKVALTNLWPNAENWDAHNSISIAVDGDGQVHIAWTSHSGSLHYARTSTPGDISTFSTRTMIGSLESVTTYPEFYRLSTGDLLFLYRSGVSGNGQAVLNRYSVASDSWTRLSDNLISGQGARSAYWQACVDSQDRLHISWTWRESGNVASNHDIAYMRASSSANTSWVKAGGAAQTIPATLANSSLAASVPQNSALMNQTTMAVDDADNPVIASFWRVGGAVQYHIVRWTGSTWLVENIGERWSDFQLGGVGTVRVPVARPLVLASGSGSSLDIRLIIRDDESGGKLEMLRRSTPTGSWVRSTLVDSSLHAYEPSIDLQAYRFAGRRELFVQDVWQADNEGLQFYPKQNVYVISIP